MTGRDSVPILEARLATYPLERYPVQHATLRYNLGLALLDRPARDRRENVRRAREAFEAALQVFTEATLPKEHAKVRIALGTVLREWSGDRTANLRSAIEHFEAAARLLSPEESPAEYATALNNLGLAYAELPGGDREENLRQAIAAYEEAIAGFRRAEAQQQEAVCRFNLGVAHAAAGGAENLDLAIDAYRRALSMLDKEASPLQYGMVQNNVGVALRELRHGDREAHLEEARRAFEHALEVYSRATHPAAYATVMSNLGLVYAERSMGDRAANLRWAIHSYRRAREVLEADRGAERRQVEENLRQAEEALRSLGEPLPGLEPSAQDLARALEESSDATRRQMVRELLDGMRGQDREARLATFRRLCSALHLLAPDAFQAMVTIRLKAYLEVPQEEMEQLIEAEAAARAERAPDEQAREREAVRRSMDFLFGPQRDRLRHVYGRLEGSEDDS